MSKSCWVITDGAAGNANQAIALADALGLDAQRIDLRWRGGWRLLAPHFMPRDFRSAFAGSDRLQPPWPRLAIGCGRLGAAALVGLRTLSSDTRTVQILDPRIAPERFDVLVVPAHDRVRADNVLTTLGALSRVNREWLAQARGAHTDLADTAEPRTSLLIGGPSQALRMDRRYLTELAQILRHWHERDGGSLWISTSRRTGSRLRGEVDRLFGDFAQAITHPEDGTRNPYPGYLAFADRIVVTPDSANMLCEACATPTPVLTHAPGGVRGKLGLLHQELVVSGRVRPLKLAYTPWTPEPRNDLDWIASQIRERLGFGN